MVAGAELGRSEEVRGDRGIAHIAVQLAQGIRLLPNPLLWCSAGAIDNAGIGYVPADHKQSFGQSLTLRCRPRLPGYDDELR